MSTFHPATSSLVNFKNTMSKISMTRFFVYISCSHQDKNLRLSWHHSSSSFYLPTTLLICCQATEGIAVLEVWSIFPFTIKHILGIKHIFSCSLENKRMCLLTHVYGINVRRHTHTPSSSCTYVHSQLLTRFGTFRSAEWKHSCS